jgi:hypothetical protein
MRTVGEIEDAAKVIALLRRATEQQEKIIELLETLIEHVKTEK